MDRLGQRIETLIMVLVLCMCQSPRSHAEEDDSGFEKMPPPKEGDWLAVHKERGQTFDDYKALCRNPKPEERDTLYLQPLGKIADAQKELIETLREYLAIFFDCKCVARKAMPLPQEAFHPGRRAGWDQYDADVILEALKQTVPPNAIAVAGITDQDLFHANMNFVFGLASFTDCAGVYSIRRYGATYPGQPKDCTLLKRTLKVANHEIGHLFRMEHCICYKCTMNGSNSLEESDTRPIHLCPVCLKKLEWSTGFNRLERYKKLRDFYNRIGLKEDAEFVGKQIGKIGRNGR